MRYIYCDESEFDNDGSWHAYGMLITREVPSRVVQQALTSLDGDPDRFLPPWDKVDTLTLKRARFHASEDSKNAHSHLCTAIRTSLSGSFSSTYIRADERTAIQTAYELPAILTCLEIFQSPEPATFLVEKRPGLNETALAAWYLRLERSALESIHDNPHIPLHFPQIKIDIDSKSNPGLQCVDFILWAVGRTLGRRDNWIHRIGCRFESRSVPQPGGWKTFDLEIGRKPPARQVDKLTYPIDRPISPDNDINDDTIAAACRHCLAVLRFYTTNALPRVASHLAVEVLESSRLKSLSTKDLQTVASAYLKLFDTASLISTSNSPEEVRRLLCFRWLFGLILRQDLMHSVLTSMRMAKFMRSIVGNLSETHRSSPR